MVELRRLDLQDVEQALQLSEAENWNQTEKEWELLIGNKQNICVAATLGDKLIGTATVINYENKVGWIGMVIVDKEYRGQKISNLLLSGIIENSKNIISLKLDATPAGQPVYQKFDFTSEYLVYRFISMSVFKNEVHFEPGVSVERGLQLRLTFRFSSSSASAMAWALPSAARSRSRSSSASFHMIERVRA